jgi:hypothetical protein
VDNLTPAGRLWRSLLNQLVQDVPDANGLCEFDCRKLHCTLAEWERCERRLQRAAGELMPRQESSHRSLPVGPGLRSS